MQNKRVEDILNQLENHYPQAQTALNYSDAFQLLIAVVLSARSTDDQVNKITPRLFSRFGDVHRMAAATPEEVGELIKSCGLYKNKSRNLVQMAQYLIKYYNGNIPDQAEELMKLPGVGKKTANVVVSTVFNQPAIAVDTHVYRVSRRLELAQGSSVEEVEKELMAIIPRHLWTATHHRLIFHGRSLCLSQRPRCSNCFLQNLCPSTINKG